MQLEPDRVIAVELRVADPLDAPGVRLLERVFELVAVDGEPRQAAHELREDGFEAFVDVAEPAIVVPASAVVTFAGIDKVVTIDSGKALEKRVELGRREGDHVEVLQGLRAGEPVVVQPGNLVSGDPVTVR